jgi:hypothetical protein
MSNVQWVIIANVIIKYEFVLPITYYPWKSAGMAELADAPDLGSG